MTKNKYRVVWAKTLEKLQDDVTTLMTRGWTCQGGLTLWVNHKNVLERSYYQPMILIYD